MSGAAEGRETDTGLWMVPYADLMSTLVILFLALYAGTKTRSAEYARATAQLESGLSSGDEAAAARERLDEARLAVEIKEKLAGIALKDFGVNVDARYVRLTLPAPVLFAEGSAELGPRAETVLSALAPLFASVENPVLVEGHTDDVPVAGGRLRSNWQLSAARALSVVRFLVEKGGLDRERFYVRGYSQYRPAASNADEEGRARNRRIELSLVRSRAALPAR